MKDEVQIHNTSLLPLALQLKEIVNQFQVISYARVYRGHNTLADSLSKEGLIQHQYHISEDEFWEGSLVSSRTIHLHDY
jgi:hypothetical protein